VGRFAALRPCFVSDGSLADHAPRFRLLFRSVEDSSVTGGADKALKRGGAG
jgi:hypothetical protein